MMKSRDSTFKSSINTIASPSCASTNRSTAFMTSIPSDDLAFVQNEIKMIDRDIYIREEHKKKIWNQTPKDNPYYQHWESNYKRLVEIKKKEKKSQGLQSVDWSKPQNFFSKDNLETVFDSLQIKNYMINKSMCKERYIDLHTYTTQSREICLRNMLLDLMQEEKAQMNREQVLITNALSGSMQKLNEDIEIFDRFTDTQRKIHKQNNLDLIQLIKDNKRLMEKKKKVNQEHRQLLDEVEKTIRIILNMKYFAVFAHSILGGNNQILHCKLDDKLDIKNREKDLEENTAKVFKELGYLTTDHPTETNILNDPSSVMQFYNQIEGNIIKLIHQKEDAESEKAKYIAEAEFELKDLRIKAQYQEDEYEHLLLERQKILQDITNIKKLVHYGDNIKADFELIKDIGKLLEIDPDLYLQEKNLMKYIHATLETLNEREAKVIYYTDKLSEIEEDELLLKICERIKKNNRIQRQYDEIRHLNELENLKKAKLNKKMNQIVIKGRGRNNISIRPPITKKEKAQIVMKESCEVNDDMDMIVYS